MISAGKRPPRLGSLPGGVSVIGSPQLQDTGVTETGSVARQTAGFITTNLGAARNKILLRGLSDGTFTGQAVNTPFGQVQVQVTVSGGTITDVTALHLTDADGRSVQISNRAAPILHDEVLSAQSANVQMVGGATYTSEGYLMSLQSALDQAGL